MPADVATGRSAISARQNRRHPEFIRLFKKLPANIQALAEKQFELFRKDPFHPSLNNHALKDSDRGRHRKGSRSVAVSRRYRAIYVEDGEVNVWYWIGSHEDYNNFTR